MSLGLGDFGLVWSWPDFFAAVGFGFGFGYLVIANISAQERWRTSNAPRAYGWTVGVAAAYFLVGADFAFAIAGIANGDPNWPRIVSRIGPHLILAAATGVGVWRGLVAATGKGGLDTSRHLAEALDWMEGRLGR